MAREKGMGSLQREKSGRWTMRVCIGGKRFARTTRTRDREQAERFLQRFLSPLGLGERRLPLADVWLEYVKSPKRNELAPSTLAAKRNVWMHFARWMEQNYLPVKDLGGVTADMVGEYLADMRADICATTYNGRVCVLREIFHTLAAKAGLEDDPWEGVRLRPDDSHSRRELTLDELRRLLAAAKEVGGAVKVRGAIERSEIAERSVGLREQWNWPTCSEGHGRDGRPSPSAFDLTTDSALNCECGGQGTDRPTAPQRSSPREKDGAVHCSPSPSASPFTFTSSSEWHTLFLIGIYTGLRLGDCCRLDWSSINLAEGVIQIVPQKTRRHAHGKPVTIPIHPALGAALLEKVKMRGAIERSEIAERSVGLREQWNWPTCSEGHGRAASPVAAAFTAQCDVSLYGECGGQGTDRPTAPREKGETVHYPPSPSASPFTFTFFHPSGAVLPTIAAMYATSRPKVSGMLARIFKEANITTSVKIEGRRHKTPEATFHSLRHTFVSFAANAGVPLHVVQSIVGHESTAMTRHYYHENLSALKNAVAVIPIL